MKKLIQKTLDRYYSSHCGNYDSIMRMLHLRGISNKNLVERLDIKPGDSILDAGTGTGENLRFLPEYAEITALDRNREMMEVAQKKAAELELNIDFVIGDLRSLSFPNDYFDFAILTYTLSGCLDNGQALNEVVRVTKPDGIMGVLDFKKTKRHSFSGFSGIKLERLIKKQEGIEILEKKEYERKNLGLYTQQLYLLKVA